MGVELVFLLAEGLWASSVWLLAIIVVTWAPAILGPPLLIRIPLEFEILAILFVFAALFLGEFRSYYERFWWWDIALHTTSGLLLGLLSFLLLYVLNENKRIDINMRPGLEIFEFICDQVLGTNMQKSMMGDPSGLTDTMWELIVDAFEILNHSIVE